MLKNFSYLIQQSGSLMQMPRSHKRSLGNTFDTVASHSHHVAVIAYCIARMENLTHKQAMKTVTMTVFHDIAEASTGDIDFIAKHYVTANEDQAVKDYLENIPFGDDLHKLMQKYQDRESLESKCAKDADHLEQMYQEWVLSWQGNKLADKWLEFDFKDRVPGMKTESAKN